MDEFGAREGAQSLPEEDINVLPEYNEKVDLIRDSEYPMLKGLPVVLQSESLDVGISLTVSYRCDLSGSCWYHTLR